MLEEHIRFITKGSNKKGQRSALAEANVNTEQSPVKKDQRADIHIVPNRMCNSDTPQRQPVCAEDPAKGRKNLQAMHK